MERDKWMNSKMNNNIKAIDRAAEPILEFLFANKYKFLIHSHGQKTR